jgi:hypothetical protein
MKVIKLSLLLVLLLGGYMAAEDSPSYNDDLDYAQVLFVTAEKTGDETWSFDVKVRHADTGWDHYANLWEVVEPESGDVLGSRELLHPHVDEQPFVRSLRDVKVPESVKNVLVRARCNKHGFEGKQVVVDLTTTSGEDFTVERE